MHELVNRLTELNGQQATNLLHTLAISDIDFAHWQWELLIEHKPVNNSLLSLLLKKIQTLLKQQ